MARVGKSHLLLHFRTLTSTEITSLLVECTQIFPPMCYWILAVTSCPISWVWPFLSDRPAHVLLRMFSYRTIARALRVLGAYTFVYVCETGMSAVIYLARYVICECVGTTYVIYIFTQ